MNKALWVAKTGLDAQQTRMAIISNNLANVNTTGFKRGRGVFVDLLYQNVRQPGAQSTQDARLPSGLMLGTGVRVAATDKIFREFNISLVKAMSEIPDVEPKAKAEAFIRTYLRYSRSQPALHRIILQEASYPSERLDWLTENHLKPLFDEVHKALVGLQDIGVVPPGSAAMLFNMIRVSAGGLLALSTEIRGTSNLDLDSDEALDALSDMIIRVFFPGRAPATD